MNGADLRNECVKAGIFAIRAMGEYFIQENFVKVRSVCSSCHINSTIS